MGDPAPDGCEECGAGPLERVLYPVAVHFKGSGFYSTDYGRGGRKKELSKEGSGGDGGGSDGSSSSDGGSSSDGDSAPKKNVEKKKPAEA